LANCKRDSMWKNASIYGFSLKFELSAAKRT